MKNAYKIGVMAATVFCLGAGCVRDAAIPAPPPAPVPTVIAPATPPPSVAPDLTANASPPSPPPQPPPFKAPLPDTLSRVTKKTFGLYVTPKNSPVSPERFTGYHVGIDFETTPDEQNVDVPIDAVCDGTLALKEYASGYGGVAVERCKLSGADITVIYGHLRLASILPKAGQALKAGDPLGVLGTGYSQETDGERKHLHLGVHKGRTITIKGYVQTKAELSGWLDPLPLFK